LNYSTMHGWFSLRRSKLHFCLFPQT
jgi:hypothetical protein